MDRIKAQSPKQLKLNEQPYLIAILSHKVKEKRKTVSIATFDYFIKKKRKHPDDDDDGSDLVLRDASL